ncbi:hypothetical protein GS429_04290 [Natronorubrum sp. JWXQ-INN-674]|uniref:PGF-CTERM sorting domain-containing protein n=1 Tax=Natronorubrum halalkaliphilum TaxID=2691917 RepID=A0A6B0VJM3_9EURY|nr:hypothetical protein [Natronorubrum halalkaliphilum]MXV61295.1 hypothetical protein [Natronorubrum halalkaliphilum]
MQFSKITTAVVALSLITIGLVGFAAIGAAEDTELTELENTTVETTENTSYVELDLEFAEEFTNTDSEDVALTVYDETEYNDSEIDETPVLEDSVTGSPNETVTNEYTVGTEAEDDLEPETEYRAIIEVENEDHIAGGYIAADDETVGGVMFGEDADSVPGFGAGIAVAAAAIATAGLVARTRAGGA